MRKKQAWIMAGLLALLFTLIVTAGFYYLYDVKGSLWEQSVMDVLEVTEQGGHAFEVYIEKNADTLKIMSGYLGKISAADRQAVLELLQMTESAGKYDTIYDLDRGVYYMSDSQEIKEMDEETLSAYRRLPQSGVLEPYLNHYNGHATLGYFERFSFADGTAGLIRRGELISDVSHEFSLSFYNDTGFSYIVNKDGDILLRSAHKNSNRTFLNLFDVIEAEGNSQDAIEAFHQAFREGQKGAMQLLFGQEDHIFAYVPVAGTDGWYVVSIVPNESIMTYANQILRSSGIFVFVIGTCMLIGVVFLVFIRQSIHTVREKEKEIQYREQLFNILANNTEDVFLLLTSDHYKVEYVSPNVERVLGVSETDVRENIRMLEVGEEEKETGDQSASYQAIKDMEPGTSLVYESRRMHKKTKEYRWFLEFIYYTRIDDAEKYIVEISDRTAEHHGKQALEDALSIAKAANVSKSAFLSNMSHDIRTPMNAIVGLCTLLTRDADNGEKVRDHARKITLSSQHLLGLINDVLDMSKIESGKTTLNVTDIFLGEIVDELETIIRPQARAKGQEFEIAVYDIETEHLFGDKLRINQVLINILSNAVKYTPEGGRISLVIRQMFPATGNYVHLRFAVEDNGIGISKEYQQEIFEPFTREESSMTSKIQGTGLGMAITRNLVELMGGTIRVESELGRGSTFTVDLELRARKQDVDEEFWKIRGITRMLVADADRAVCAGILAAMAGSGVAIETAKDGYEVIDIVAQAHKTGEDFDLVLLDFKMPDLNGIEAAERIQGFVKKEKTMVVLFAYDWSEVEEKARKAGIDGFLTKPFFLSNFRQVIENIQLKYQEKPGEEEQQNVLEGLHFLAAEDNDLNVEILVELLEMAGAKCDVAENGQRALEMFENSSMQQYDMILMDVQMPVMNGYEATRAIRSCSHPRAEEIPIIAMTANAFIEDVQEAKAAGMNEHLAKPLNFTQLGNVIQKFRKKEQ